MQRRTLGKRNIEKDAKDLRVLINQGPISSTATEFQLQSDTIVTDTTIVTNRTPLWLLASGFWIAIDPWTIECEIRKVTAVSGSTLTVAALTYAHSASDPVLFLDAPIANVKWFGALGDGTTSDETALHRAFTAAENLDLDGGTILVPNGIYPYTTNLELDEKCHLLGEGYDTVLKASAAISMLRIDWATTAGNRYGSIRNIRLDGNSTATVGLDIELAVLWRFEHVFIHDVSGSGLRCDATQNSTFDTIYSTGNTKGLYMANGAAGNTFINCHITSNSSYHGHWATDAGLSGNAHSIGDNKPNSNRYYGCYFESGTPTNAILFDDGARNLFSDCHIVGSTSSADGEAIKITSGAVLNKFDHCRVSEVGAGAPLVSVASDYTYLVHCSFVGWTGTFEWLHTEALTIVDQCFIAADGEIANQSGNIWDNIDFTPLIRQGDTPPSMGDHIGTQYYDRDSGYKPFYYTGSAWTDAINGRLWMGNSVEKTIASAAINPTRYTFIRVDTENNDATDDLETISGASQGDILILRAENTARTVVVKHNVDNIYLQGVTDISLDDASKYLMLIYGPDSLWHDFL